MIYPIGIFTIIAVVFNVCTTYDADAAVSSPSPFSSYGNIQNVKKYSSNPFWNKDSPYNQKFPKAIYVDGADLNTGDCNRIVENLIASYCSTKNGCKNARINDVRPQIMVQLSQLPGHNFATSCGGYIDAIFEKYETNVINIPATTSGNQHTNIVPTAFPTAKSTTAERTEELERLQKMTTPKPSVSATNFPKTTADLSFADRLANTTAGYEPYKDLKPYKIPDFEEENEYWARMKSQNKQLYCQEFPNDDACKITHRIIYNLFGGTYDSKAPTEYIEGRDTIISWIPTRDNSIFQGWCTTYMSGILGSCSMSQIISKTDKTDKIFYAKWTCQTGFKDQGDKCVAANGNAGSNNGGSNNGGGNNGGGSSGGNPTLNPNCSDPLYMDKDCNCTNIQNTHEDPTTHKCVCDNGNSIEDACDSESEYIIADCRARQLRNHLLPQRNKWLATVADVSSFDTYCINRKEASTQTSSCISHCNKLPKDDSQGGAASNLFQEITNLPMCRPANDPILSTNIPGTGNKFKMPKQKMDEFIAALKNRGTDSTGRSLQTTCKRENRTAWVLLIDKVKNGRTAVPYATVCLGGAECTTGEVTWHQ